MVVCWWDDVAVRPVPAAARAGRDLLQLRAQPRQHAQGGGGRAQGPQEPRWAGRQGPTTTGQQQRAITMLREESRGVR